MKKNVLVFMGFLWVGLCGFSSLSGAAMPLDDVITAGGNLQYTYVDGEKAFTYSFSTRFKGAVSVTVPAGLFNAVRVGTDLSTVDMREGMPNRGHEMRVVQINLNGICVRYGVRAKF